MLNIIFSIQKYIGILDIIVIVLLIVGLLLGFIIGFSRILIKIANWICGMFVSLILCAKFAKVLKWIFGDPIYNHFYKKVMNTESLQNLTGSETAQEGLAAVLKDLGIPGWLSKFISKGFSGESTASIAESISDTIASGITKAILLILSFVILWVGLSLIILLIKLHIEDLRENHTFMVIDGMLGSILGIIVMFFILEIVFYIVTLADASNNVMNFLNRDMRLETYSGFGLARWFYSHNWIKAFLDLFF
jgi:uncharacterized membrane protein required for colicin V production